MTRSASGFDDACPVCGKPRKRAVKVAGCVYRVGVMCDCEERLERERVKREEGQRRYMRRVRAFGSAELTRCRFENDDGACPDASRACESYADSFADAMAKGYGLLLFGTPDQGKTFLSACIANRVIDGGHTVTMRSVPDIVAASGAHSDSMIESMMAYDLLVLDDLGAERDTSYSREVIYRVIESRHSRKKPMVVSTNLSMRNFRQPENVEVERIYNRILERCLPVPVESGRRRAKKETYADIRATIGIS